MRKCRGMIRGNTCDARELMVVMCGNFLSVGGKKKFSFTEFRFLFNKLEYFF
jgi:hypothetical protein